MKEQSLDYSEFLKIKKKNQSNKHNRVAVITGAFGRIGSVFLNELLYRGYTCICLSRNKIKFQDLKKNMEFEKFKKIVWIKYDLNKIEDVDKVTKIIGKKYKKIDCLINCAMNSNRGKNFSYNKKKYLKEMLGIFGAPFLLTESLLKFLRKSNNGNIINVGSVWGSHAPRFDVYLEMDIGPTPIIAAGKAALIQYTKFIAARESEFNIRANCLIPGWFPRKGKIERKDYIKKIVNNIPKKRIGNLHDLVPSVNFLLSDTNEYYTGQSLYVDGGYSIF